MARARRPRTDHRACAWTRALQHQLVLDLQWLVQPPGWTPLDDCGVQVAVRCHSADPRLRIGGDWHLSMPLAGGDLLHCSKSIDQGIDAVASLAAAARCCPPELLDRIAYDAAGDDACVLVAERVR